MIETAVFGIAVLAALLVMASGIWVAVAMIRAIRHVDHPVSLPPADTSDEPAD